MTRARDLRRPAAWTAPALATLVVGLAGCYLVTPLLAVVGAIAFFALALPRLGLPLTVAVTVFGVSFATPEARWRTALPLALGMGVFCSAVFVGGLRLNLPLWPRLSLPDRHRRSCRRGIQSSCR